MNKELIGDFEIGCMMESDWSLGGSSSDNENRMIGPMTEFNFCREHDRKSLFANRSGKAWSG